MNSPTKPPTLLDSAQWAGLRVGLLGGSFDPPHKGHMHIAATVMQGLELDAVWWLVTPQNPIKERKPLSLEKRIAMCEDLIDDPRMVVSGIEAELGTTRTYDTVCALKQAYPETEFVWMSGVDQALELHHWYRWQDLLGEIAFVHLARDPEQIEIPDCPVRDYERQEHHIVVEDGCYSLDSGQTYWMMQKKVVKCSSSEMRAKSKDYE